MYRDKFSSNLRISKTGGVDISHGSGHASATGEYSLWIKMNLRWKKMYPWLPVMNRPPEDSIKGTNTPKGSEAEQQLTGARKLYSLWLRALAFLDVSIKAQSNFLDWCETFNVLLCRTIVCSLAALSPSTWLH